MHVRLADEIGLHRPAAGVRELSQHSRRSSPPARSPARTPSTPGYGFLSENARFADILEAHDITFIGPTAEQIRVMGDKIEAKRTAARAGSSRWCRARKAPCAPTPSCARIAAEIGYPVLIKASAGGGGRGMTIARSADEVVQAAQRARSEAKAAFGNDEVYLEKYLTTPRHIEVQVMGDGRGDAVVARRARLLAAAPPPEGVGGGALTGPQRGRAPRRSTTPCAKAMRGMNYRGAGTIEFLYEDGEFYFIEMNTRLQVEHPVTEMITGIDLVHAQLRVASGGKLGVTQEDIRYNGHAIECRINAEHPRHLRARHRATITHYHPPGGLGVRVDSAVYQGYRIPPYYDSLIGKLIVHGNNRVECLMRLRRSLDEFVVDGVNSTLPLFRELIHHPDIANGAYDIHWLEKFLAEQKAA